MSLAMKARQRVKRKGPAKDRVFGCDLVEHLQLSGRDVPQVLKCCTEFVEQHGIVDGIYRLSGISSNIQKLRLEFDSDRGSPDLNKDVYLQDIHCVSSLCKAYFRELPNPLLTYQLYDKFADAVAIQLEEGRLEKIKEVLKELPAPHYRTLEFLMKHLVHMASYSPQTSMHVRNLAIVWAPNLLRSKDIEASGFNGTAAFMEVRIQSIVVEFILAHVDQIFGDAPLCAGSRESLRKSLLLLGSPVTFADDKYSFSCNVPAVLNQGDGPPQMRPYHTIIELTDSKRKGSLKAKKWKSIFNLGRSSNDSKRKLNKPEDKDDKVGKMRLRPAKSMDSLSSVPCPSDDDVQLGRKKKQLTLCRDSFDGPASLDNSFLESDEYPDKTKTEETQGESEGEATAKSEPTTPKPSRSSLVGVAPQGRSPKAMPSRAEKCVGVHISGPFSVTVPFHITSNLTLSRLTRGLECPALNHCTLEKDAAEASGAKEEEPSKQEETEQRLMPTLATSGEDPGDAKAESLPDSEENRMSMEVQDSFSFLDSQEAWLGDSLDADQPWKSSITAPDFASNGMDSFPVMEDDVGSGFMNEMIVGGMQLEMFSAAPPMDYLSIEECMNEHSEEEDDQYYLAMGYVDDEELSKEVDSEEVYLSAFDDLSPLAHEVERFQQSDGDRAPDEAPPLGNMLEDQPFSLSGGISSEDPTGSHLFEDGTVPFLGGPQVHALGLDNCHLDSDLANLSEEESGDFPNSRSNFNELETLVTDEAEDAKANPRLPVLQIEGPNAGGGDDLLLETGCLVEAKCPDGVPETSPQISLVQENQNHTTQPNLENEWELHTQNALDVEAVEWPPCTPGVKAAGSTQQVAGMSDKHADCKCLFQEAEQLQSGETALHPQTVGAPSSLEDPTLLRARLSSLLDNCSENASSNRSPVPAPMPVSSPEHDASSERAPSDIPLPSSCNDASSFTASSLGCPERLPQTPPHAVPVKALDALGDGSVHMKLTSSTIRVQQVKSFPVVPPKPQFAKIPPSLIPRTPIKEVSTVWPNPPVPDENCGNGTKDESNKASLRRPLRPASLDMYCNTTENAENVETLLASSKLSPSLNNCSNSGTSQKQRNSMPVCLEKYDRDYESGGDSVPKPLCSPLDKHSLWPKSGLLSGDDLHNTKCSLPESLDKCSSSNTRSEDEKGEPSPKQLPGPVLLEKCISEASGAAPQKQRLASWRNGGSRSFDEAVALAKGRHVGQTPMRRMQTYSYGDTERLHDPPRTEKPPPHPKPALKPLGQRPLRPLACTGTAAVPDAHILGKPFLAQALPDITPEGQPSPNQEALSLTQDLPPRSRLSLQTTGRRSSSSEEALFALPQEQR
ncbi:rho GTPase-activating protein 30 isoform X2 [Rhineura floridana]|uniref:rho GTPase-activating protein 30 isoform X2 n=1 Tax=Rhineura floridana TaxID=261503 RepID=UPI002AC844E9|nr:rho GTPase-activating protein 30 isoform X2 [Rhineura floridana]